MEHIVDILLVEHAKLVVEINDLQQRKDETENLIKEKLIEHDMIDCLSINWLMFNSNT